MMLVAAGMASSGKIPFASTFAIFTERAFEQVRNGIARPGLPVHICGSHGGIHTGSDGSSAQSIEDLAIYRTIPKMTVIHPCDDISAEELTAQLLGLNGPSYMRTARNKVPRMYEDGSNLRIGSGSVLRQGGDLAIISCGVMVGVAISAAETLSNEGISCTVVDMHTIKPIDVELIAELSESCGAFVTAEDHSVIGGLGELFRVAFDQYLDSLEMVGVRDSFGQSGGSSELMDLMGLNEAGICEAARRAISRK